MTAFSVSEAAQREIRAQLNSSRHANPAASLLDSGPAKLCSPDLEAAILGDASEAELFAIGKNEFAAMNGDEFHLAVGIYSAHDCRPQDLAIIDGLQFAMPKELRDYFADYVLDVEQDNFVLRNGNRTIRRMRDLEKE